MDQSENMVDPQLIAFFCRILLIPGDPSVSALLRLQDDRESGIIWGKRRAAWKILLISETTHAARRFP
jgi:hypothetical protein